MANAAPQIRYAEFPIGSIIREVEEGLRLHLRGKSKTLNAKTDAIVTNVYDEFDSKYQGRIDYKLWRTAGLPLASRKYKQLAGCRTARSAAWGHWATLAGVAAESEDEVLFWSTIALASDLIKRVRSWGSQHDDKIETEFWSAMSRLQERLRSEVKPLSWCPVSCEMAAALFLMQYQFRFLPTERERRWREFQSQHQISNEAIEKWLGEVDARFRAIDRDWRPSRRLNTTSLEKERKERGVLRGGNALEELASLTESLREIFPFISENEAVLDAKSMELRNRGCEYAYTAWRTARSWRLARTERQEKTRKENSYRAAREEKSYKEDQTDAFGFERDCILNLANALRDAERYLESAFVNFVFLRLVPDEFKDAPNVRGTLRNRGPVFLQLREAGFEVDSRFSEVERAAEEQDLKGEQGKAPKNEGGYFRVLQRDQANMDAWATILNELPQKKESEERLKAYLRRVMRFLAGTDKASETTLEAGYRLALRYGYIRTAAKILMRAVEHDAFVLKKADVIKLAERIVECTCFDPFALDYQTFGEWQRLIRRACFKLYENRSRGGWLTDLQRLWIHEVLLSRTHSHYRRLTPESASRLFGKAVGIFKFEHGLREFYDREHNFLQRPRAIAKPERLATQLAEYCRGTEESRLGGAVYVSLLCMRDIISIIGIGGRGRIETNEIEVGELHEDLQYMAGDSRFWFKREKAFDRQIEWSENLERIGCAIVQIARKCNRYARVIMLAVEPHLAALPWQHLLSVCLARLSLTSSADEARTQYLVSIIPNASAVVLGGNRKKGLESGIKKIISNSGGHGISEVKTVIDRTTSTGEESEFGVLIVLGHGERREELVLPVADLGDGQQIDSIEKWIEIIRSRHVILHCCHSGRADPLFMHELGGLPGLALNLGSTAMLAPVTEVGERTAIALQESLFENASLSIGESYLKAISNNRSVCLYNYFGDPYDQLRQHSS
jgi:hypothetical protein